MKKYIWIGVIVFAVVVVSFLFKSNTQTGIIKIGMIIPLSGPAADYGVQMKGGAEIAKQELLKKGIDVNIVYEDSKVDPATGISAYRRLIDVENVNYMVSAFTRVSLPLIEMTAKDKMPMIMTIFAGNWDKTKSPYAIRFFPTPRQYVRGEDGANVLAGVKTASVIYVNDDYGKSVLNELDLFLTEKGITLLSKEGYTPSSSDFRTALTKIKPSNSDILSIISSSPVEISNIIKQAKEVGITAKVFDSSIALSNPNVYKNPANNVEGVITKATLAELKDKSPEVENFFTEYQKNNSKEAYWAALFGYESVNLVAGIDKNGGQTNLDKAVTSLKTLKTLFGDIAISDYQEINPVIINTEVRGGYLVPVK
jgi:branched-chain amino acid transport system substrate-binding protein